MKELTILDEKSLVKLFTEGDLDETLKKIEQEVLSVVPDTASSKGRKEIASLAMKVAKSKVAIDKAGKELVSDWKAKSKLVDASRKESREFLDNLKAEVRKPLTEWEDEKERKETEAKLSAELLIAHIEGLQENSLFDREKVMLEKEAEASRIASEKRLAEEKRLSEERIKERAELRAKEKAEAEAQSKIDEAERFEAEAVATAERLKREAIEAKENARLLAEKADNDRLQAEKDAKAAQERAVRQAEENARYEAKCKEADRLQAEEDARVKADKLAANKAHRAKFNREAVKSFTNEGFSETVAKNIITLIAQGKIKNVSVNY